MSIVYEINRGINRPIEFKGLKGPYIFYMGGGFGILLILFAIGYLAGANLYVCIGVIGLLGCGLYTQVTRLSRQYGVHGLMKTTARRQVPPAISCHTRSLFTRLRKIPT
jgi:hypothetical protein